MKSLLIFSSIFYIAACSQKVTSEADVKYNDQMKALKYAEAEIWVPDGMAGCSFLIKLADEKKLEPVNLADSLKHEHLKLWIRYHPEKNSVSNCMMGTLVVLDDVKYRK